MHQIDGVDKLIIAALQQDGKVSIHELAARLGLSLLACRQRVRKLEDEGIIKGYTAIVDHKKVGLPISAFAAVKLESNREQDFQRFAQTVANWTEVTECYLITGQRDYLMRIVARDLDAYEQFLKEKLTRLDRVASIVTSFALTQVKRSVGLPLV